MDSKDYFKELERRKRAEAEYDLEGHQASVLASPSPSPAPEETEPLEETPYEVVASRELISLMETTFGDPKGRLTDTQLSLLIDKQTIQLGDMGNLTAIPRGDGSAYVVLSKKDEPYTPSLDLENGVKYMTLVLDLFLERYYNSGEPKVLPQSIQIRFDDVAKKMGLKIPKGSKDYGGYRSDIMGYIKGLGQRGLFLQDYLLTTKEGEPPKKRTGIFYWFDIYEVDDERQGYYEIKFSSDFYEANNYLLTNKEGLGYVSLYRGIYSKYRTKLTQHRFKLWYHLVKVKPSYRSPTMPIKVKELLNRILSGRDIPRKGDSYNKLLEAIKAVYECYPELLPQIQVWVGGLANKDKNPPLPTAEFIKRYPTYKDFEKAHHIQDFRGEGVKLMFVSTSKTPLSKTPLSEVEARWVKEFMVGVEQDEKQRLSDGRKPMTTPLLKYEAKLSRVVGLAGLRVVERVWGHTQAGGFNHIYFLNELSKIEKDYKRSPEYVRSSEYRANH